MSGKTSKRRQRRINTTEEEAEKKTEETIEVSDDNKSNVSLEEKEENLPKEQIEEVQQEETKETLEVIETVENGKTDEEKTIEKTNGTESQTSHEDNSDIEPLILDSEEQELQFPSETGSENSEIEKSPVINRCKTRRSQSRNLPTPKTPKSLDYNGETDDKKCQLNELRVNVTRLQPEVVIEEPEIDNISVAETDVTNSSVFVNVDDTTRNIDITTTTLDDSQLNASNFLENNKDKSYGQTLRCLTGRKTIRTNYKPRFYSSNIDLTDSSKTYSPISGIKRKLDNESPGEQKKPKIDNSGLFSYISSPFLKSKVQSDIQSSTPKLTSFKFMENEDEKLEIKNAEKVEPKKWCSLM